MKTKIIKIDDVVAQQDDIQMAAAIIEGGGLVAFPTETVYGLGALGLNLDAVQALFAAKNRPVNKSFSLQVAELSMVASVVKKITPMAEKLFKAFCPGPITIILPKNELVPEIVTGGKETVGIRIPANPIAIAILHSVGEPLAVPSANISTHPSPISAQQVYDDMKGRLPLILDGGVCNVGVESTVVDCSGDVPIILREGAISAERIFALVD